MTVQQPPPDDPTVFRSPAGAAQAAPQLTPGTILGGRYRIVSLVGSGGMGQVYRADDLKLGQTVALKFLAHQRSDDRIYDEVRIGRQISHPNVCRLYDIAEVDGRQFITMEFVDGEDLASLLRRIGRLPAEKALMLTRDLCAGLAAAHEKGVIHRDLKPANVMIDGRGRGRITDFGLALAGEGSRELAGTPLYMAPEQFEEAAASARSDIYALGLVLYEIFTGRRAFDSPSAEEALDWKRRGNFSRPSQLMRDIPPAIEQVIERCLSPLPQARPATVEEVLRELPGFDPLAAAIAAGETPSPGMVAAAAERGDLPRAAAWTLLLLSIAGLISYAALTSHTMVYRNLPVKPPDVLADHVNAILAASGQPLERADAAGYFLADSRESLQFHWRQSPKPMMAGIELEQRIRDDDPPWDVPGMAGVITDAAGKLVEMTIVPPRVESPPAHSSPVDWTAFMHYAGIGELPRPVPSIWSAPVDSDAKQAWIAGDGTRVETAAYHGKPVWFAVIAPGRRPGAQWVQLLLKFNVVSGIVAIVFTIVFMISALVLAHRNLRRGQGDRRGATSIAVFMFATVFAAFLIRAHHPPDALLEALLMLKIASWAAFMALFVWFAYVAIEPLVRRRWPAMLIGWSRLIEGRYRDPMIGRDVLIGGTVGTLAAVAWQAAVLTPGTPRMNNVFSALSGLREVGFFIGWSLSTAVLGALSGATIMLTLHGLTRSPRLSIFLYFLANWIFFAGDATGAPWYRFAYAAILAATLLAVFIRFGLLALSFTALPFFLLRTVPLTLDSGAFYFGRSLFVLLLLGSLLLSGFLVSLGGKGWLPRLAFE